MKGKILRITRLGEPVLRRVSKPVPLPLSRARLHFIDDMIATMKKAQGVGIAAPQVNVGLRMFIVAPEPNARYPDSPQVPPVAMINPRLVSHSRKRVTDWEGCLSIPGLRARVPRYHSIEIEFTAQDGRRLRGRLSGFIARIFQHEFDHINGMVYLDRVKDSRTFMVESEFRETIPVSRYGFADVAAVLRIRDYRNFLLSRVFATLSTQMQALVVSWQVYQMTKDPLALGLIGLVEAVVFIGFATTAGHFADRHEKRRIIIVTQGILLLCAIAFLALTQWSGVTLYWLYAVVALTGLARSYMWPASFAYSELTVPREIYSRAASLNATGWEVSSVVGPAIGGFVYAWKGPAAAYAIVFVLMLLATLFTTLMGNREPSSPSAKVKVEHDFLSGFRFVFSNPVILGAISLDMFAVLFGGVYAILPIFADTLGVGARGLGWLRAAPSVGAIGMAAYQAWRPPFERVGKTLLAAVALFGVFTIAFAFSRSYPLCLFLLALTGVVDNISVVVRASIMQAFTPDPMRGRVSAVNGIFIGSSNEIGAFESGLAARLLGTVPSVVFGGTMTLLTVAFVAFKFPELRRLRRIK